MNHDELYGTGRVGDLIIAALQRYPNRIAFEGEAGATTYAELGRLIAAAQAQLAHLGLQPGDVVAQLAGNDVRTFAMIAAVYLSGLTSVALQPTLSHDDKVYIVQDSGAKLVVTDEQHATLIDALIPHCDNVVHWRLHGCAAGWIDFWKDCPNTESLPVCRGGPEDIVRLQYTGGTTGKPKGVMLSNRAQLTNAQMLLAGISWPSSIRYLCCMPMTHGGGAMIIPTLFRGGSIVMHRSFDVDAFLDAISVKGCNMTWLVPTAVYRLLDHPRSRNIDWSSMHALVYSAAPMTPARVQEALEVCGPCLVQMYGQTEAPLTILTMTQDDHIAADLRRLSSAGKEFPGVVVDLLGDDCQPVPPGEIGEICVRGPLLMSGYWKQPEQTAAAFQGDWLHTGDLARRDEAGFYYIVDRKKDMIISGGYNVYPQEIENVLAGHPAVLQSAVIGVPHPEWGEEVRAYVVPRSGASVDPLELIAQVRAAKGPVYAPKVVVLVDTLPLTVFGKVDKKALRAQAARAEQAV